jgi:flagellar motor switch protein FliG
MSMLARYRKPGGIQQLITLLESCVTKKRETLLATISAEDKDFGLLVKTKLLNPEKIFKWNPLVVCEVTTRMAERTLAICLKGMPPEAFALATHTMRDMKKREVTNFLEILKPTPIEIETAQIKLVETVRVLEKEGAIKLDENDQPILSGASAFKKVS